MESYTVEKLHANQRQATSEELELATLAGFFAGEGSITISGGPWRTLYAALGNSERLWTERFHKRFGGAFYIEKPKYAGAKTLFRWRVSGKAAYEFLKVMAPYLMGEKAAQLELGIEFQEFKWATQPKNGGQYLKVPTEVKEQLDGFYQKMRNLRRAAAETNRRDAAPWRSDSPTLMETSVS